LALKKGCCLPVTARPDLGPKCFSNLSLNPTRKARPDLQLCCGVSHHHHHFK